MVAQRLKQQASGMLMKILFPSLIRLPTFEVSLSKELNPAEWPRPRTWDCGLWLGVAENETQILLLKFLLSSHKKHFLSFNRLVTVLLFPFTKIVSRKIVPSVEDRTEPVRGGGRLHTCDGSLYGLCWVHTVRGRAQSWEKRKSAIVTQKWWS